MTFDYRGYIEAEQLVVYQGSVVWSFKSSTDTNPEVSYLPTAIPVPATWNPKLAHAPSGTVGNRWSALPGGAILRHDGTSWSEAPLPNNEKTVSVSIGADGGVYAATSSKLYHRNGPETATGWASLATTSLTIAQLAVGDADQISGCGTIRIRFMATTVGPTGSSRGPTWGCLPPI
jgi:hypothetical protein